MSISMSILLDIGGKEVLEFEAMFDLLKCVEKENLFANFPIGTTIQDCGKRKRSGMVTVLVEPPTFIENIMF